MIAIDSEAPHAVSMSVGIAVVSYRDFHRAFACLESAVRYSPKQLCLNLLLIETGPDAPPRSFQADHVVSSFESLHLPENRGYGWALACAAERLNHCEVLILSNADILFREGSIELLVSAALAGYVAAPFQFESITAARPHLDTVLLNPGLSDSISRWLGVGRRRVRAARQREVRRLLMSGKASTEISSAFSLSGAVLAIAPPVLKTIGGIPQGFFLQEEDRLLCARARESSCRLVVTGSVVHFGGLRQGRSSSSGIAVQLQSERLIWSQLGIGYRLLHESILAIGVATRVVAGILSGGWSYADARVVLRALGKAQP